MAVIKLRQFKFSYLRVTEGHNDENGDWVNGEEEWVDDVECDVTTAAQSGRAGTMTTRQYPDGEAEWNTYSISLDKDYPHTFERGEKIRITHPNNEKVEYLTVQGSKRLELQLKVWV